MLLQISRPFYKETFFAAFIFIDEILVCYPVQRYFTPRGTRANGRPWFLSGARNVE
jgi:hypothetical protein